MSISWWMHNKKIWYLYSTKYYLAMRKKIKLWNVQVNGLNCKTLQWLRKTSVSSSHSGMGPRVKYLDLYFSLEVPIKTRKLEESLLGRKGKKQSWSWGTVELRWYEGKMGNNEEKFKLEERWRESRRGVFGKAIWKHILQDIYMLLIK